MMSKSTLNEFAEAERLDRLATRAEQNGNTYTAKCLREKARETRDAAWRAAR